MVPTDFTEQGKERSWPTTRLPLSGPRGAATTLDSEGTKLGKVKEIYLDDASSQPEWLAVLAIVAGSAIVAIGGSGIEPCASTGSAPSPRWRKSPRT